MAMLDIMRWAADAMDRLVDAAGRPIRFADWREIYPDLARNTLRARLDALEALGWMRGGADGYVLDPGFVRLLHRAQRAAASALGNMVDTAKTFMGTEDD